MLGQVRKKPGKCGLDFSACQAAVGLCFVLTELNFRLFSFCCRYRKYMSFLSVRNFHYAELFWEEKHPFRRPLRDKKEDLPEAAEALREEARCFHKNVPSFYPEYRDVLCGMSRYFISPGGASGGGVRLHPLGNGFQKSENSA